MADKSGEASSKANFKQTVVPAVAPPEQMAPTPGRGVEQGEAYLREAGWVEMSRDEDGKTTWQDPAGEGDPAGEMQTTLTLPGKDGVDPMSVKQLVVPPASWAYGMGEAMKIQRQRDRAAERKKKQRVTEPAAV